MARYRLRIYLPWLILAVAALLALAGLVGYLPALFPVPAQVDFAAYYLAARVLSAGGDPYSAAALSVAAAESGIEHYTPYIYLPLFATLLGPLAALRYSTAATIWYLANAAMALLAAIMLGRSLRFPPHAILLLAGATLIFPATYGTLVFGQTGNALNLMLVGALLLSASPMRHRSADLLAGVLLGAAVALKMYPAVLGLVYLLHRRVATLLAGGLTVGGAILACLTAGGWESLRRWLTCAAPIVAISDIFPANQSVIGVTGRLFPYAHSTIRLPAAEGYTPIELSPFLGFPALRVIVPALAIIAILAASCVAIHRAAHSDDSASFWLSYAIAISAMLLLWPVTWDVHSVHLLIPLLVIARLRWAAFSYRLHLSLVCLLLALQQHWQTLTHYWASPLVMMFGFFGVLAVWIALLRIVAEDSSRLAGHAP